MDTLLSALIISCRSEYSGATVKKETPNIVSGLVVKTSILFLEFSTSKVNDTPFDFPIQFLCISFNGSGQSILFKSSKSRSEYLLILKHQCFTLFFETGYPPLSLTPFTISSFASTVPSSSHQLTSPSVIYASLKSISISDLIFSLKFFHSFLENEYPRLSK